MNTSTALGKSKATVVLADDHAILRDGLKALFNAQEDFEVVGEASNGREAVQIVNALEPDVLVTDVSMPLTNGPDAVRTLKKRHPNLKVVTLTIHAAERHVRVALESGTDAYVLKDDSSGELIRAVRHVIQGKKFLSAGIANRVVQGYLDRTNPESSVLGDTLTNRERETLKLIAEGLKNRQIADHLSVSVKTVEKHRANLMKKLDLHNGAALTAYAFENGLTSGY